MKYKFSMEKVLEWRQGNEKNTMEKFAVIQNDMLHQKSMLALFMTEFESTKENCRKHKNIQEMRQQHYYKQTIEEKIEKQTGLIHQTTENLECMRLELVAAQKDRKIIEKLKEKDFTSYEYNIKMVEQKELDEMATLKFKKLF